MIGALRGAIFEALKKKEEFIQMLKRLFDECRDDKFKEFLQLMIKDGEDDTHMLKHLNLQNIMKRGLSIKFKAPEIVIDDSFIKKIIDVDSAKDSLKIAIDQINTNIEYYEHIADHSVFPEVKRLFRLIADKDLEDKARMKALYDLLR
ncbi:hypothetical protein HQ545_00735 [Candidatus Woesearchaeota archaeon]|nr:hypothetical protein [Candidatus Woesearchaeota archaeon]